MCHIEILRAESCAVESRPSLRFYTDTYNDLLDKKLKCDNATATPFKNEDLCHEKICSYYDKKIACDTKQARTY